MKSYENYPVGTVILSNVVSIGIYGLGFLIVLKLGLTFALLYLLYILAFEFRLIRYHCTNCYYWGKTCGFGKGRLSAWFFKKGDASEFCKKNMTWRDVIPDLLITLIPLVIGIILMIMKFDILILSALLLIAFLTTYGNAQIRGKLTCNNCKQRELGCPAEALFNKGKP